MWRVETVFLEFQRFERKFLIFVLKKAHFHIRTKNVFPISDFRHVFFCCCFFLYFYEFRNIKMHDFWSPHNKKVPAFMLEFRLIFFSKRSDKYSKCFLFMWVFGCQNFQSVIFLWTRIFEANFKCALVYLCFPLPIIHFRWEDYWNGIGNRKQGKNLFSSIMWI